MKVDKLARRTDLLENVLNQYFEKWFVSAVRKYWILNVIKIPVINVSIILVIN